LELESHCEAWAETAAGIFERKTRKMKENPNFIAVGAKALDLFIKLPQFTSVRAGKSMTNDE
jgi:hypothetical protein